MKRRPKKFLNNSNKMLTALVCILAVVCLVAGGIYIDTFHGQGRFLALIGKTNRTQAQEEDTAVQEDTHEYHTSRCWWQTAQPTAARY